MNALVHLTQEDLEIHLLLILHKEKMVVLLHLDQEVLHLIEMLVVEEEQLLWGRKVERVLPQRHLQCLLLKQVDPVEREQQVQLMALQQQELVVEVVELVTHNLELHSLEKMVVQEDLVVEAQVDLVIKQVHMTEMVLLELQILLGS